MNYFQASRTISHQGSEYTARLFVDRDRKEAYLSFSRDRVLFVASYPVRYGKVWNERLAKSVLDSRRNGWGFMTGLARDAVLESPLAAAARLDEMGLAV